MERAWKLEYNCSNEQHRQTFLIFSHLAYHKKYPRFQPSQSVEHPAVCRLQAFSLSSCNITATLLKQQNALTITITSRALHYVQQLKKNCDLMTINKNNIKPIIIVIIIIELLLLDNNSNYYNWWLLRICNMCNFQVCNLPIYK
jgi:hypothetical protein